jgi:hypothetical protein
MAAWHLIFQEGDLPISVGRADGRVEEPPAGLTRYVELAHGAWSRDPAIRPLAVEAVEWPRLCHVARTDCHGTLHYVEHITGDQYASDTGEILHPAGWQCDRCGRAEVGGLSAWTSAVNEPE